MQPESQVTDGAESTESAESTHNRESTQRTDSLFDFVGGKNEDRLTAIHQEMAYINTIGKSFVAAIDRFHVHRALLKALQNLYSFSACCILLKGDPFELSIIPCHPISASFLQDMLQRISNAANVIDFPHVSVEHLMKVAYFDAPDEVAQYRTQEAIASTEIGSSLNIPLTVDNRIIGMLSLFDELIGTFDTTLLSMTGMIADYAAVALDNASLRERENALWRQAELERRRLELTLRSMTESLLITNELGAIVSLNQSAQQLFLQEKIDLKLDIPLREQDILQTISWFPSLIDIIDRAFAGQTITNQEMVVGQRGEAVPLTLSINASPLHDLSSAHLRPTGVVVVLNDVTASKQVERLKDEFVSVVSHELRTPLTAIKGYTQHLVRRIERRLRKARENQQLHTQQLNELPESYDLHSLNIVQSQTDHLERLVSELLDLSHVQDGQLTLHYSAFYLADLLAECVRSIQMSAEQHTIYLDIQVQDTHVNADYARVCQVVGNMLDNAVKYSPHGGQITVALVQKEDNYLIQVIDQGIGVSIEHYDHIFERFYRVRNAASRQYAGIGLGLYVAKAIIESHGGKIGFFNNNRGIGTTFYFTLPKAQHIPS